MTDSLLRATKRAFGLEFAEIRSEGLGESSAEEASITNGLRVMEKEVLGLLEWSEMEVGEQELNAIEAFEKFAERNWNGYRCLRLSVRDG